jgi:2-isopropylmalate synthase
MLDIGRSDPKTLEQAVQFCSRQGIELLSLPDTSGMMSPFQVFQTISKLSAIAGQTRLSIHCHNDMGMASANTVMGIEAGGSVAEVSVLGIGERNGIADLFTTARMLKDSGFDIQLNTQDLATFHAYYRYIDTIVYQQLGMHLLHANTPFFGQAVKTHVAGTHAHGQFGMASKEHYYLNSMCGRRLVKKYIARHKIDCPDSQLEKLTDQIKTESLRLNRSLTPADIKKIIVLLGDSS